jgi:hypothetical protein
MKFMAPTRSPAWPPRRWHAFPAQAQSNADLLKELQALKDRVQELEKKLKAAPAARLPRRASGA